MKERSKIKIKLTTVILFLVIALIIVFGIVYFLNFIKDKQESQILMGDNKKNISDNSVVDNTLEQSNETSSNNDVYSKEQVIKILKEAEKENKKASIVLNELIVNSIQEIEGKYIITADYYVPFILKKDDYHKMVSEGEITLDNEKYIFKNDDGRENEEEQETRNVYGDGYLMLAGEDTTNGWSGYYLKKVEAGYALIYAPSGARIFARVEIEKTIKFEVDKETEVYQIQSGEAKKIEEYVDTNLKHIINVELRDNKKDICFKEDLN